MITYLWESVLSKESSPYMHLLQELEISKYNGGQSQ